MDMTSAFLLIGATMALVAIPGPNVALFVANTLNFGARYGVFTVFGTTVGVGIQLAIVVFGLISVLQYAAWALIWLKWLGVIYLLVLGVRSWRLGNEDLVHEQPLKNSAARLFWQGLFLAIANPKTLVFLAAFLPQFVGTAPTTQTLLIAAGLYLSIVLLGDLAWVLCARLLRPALMRIGRMRHRLTGGLFMGAGVGLALTRTQS